MNGVRLERTKLKACMACGDVQGGEEAQSSPGSTTAAPHRNTEEQDYTASSPIALCKLAKSTFNFMQISLGALESICFITKQSPIPLSSFYMKTYVQHTCVNMHTYVHIHAGLCKHQHHHYHHTKIKRTEKSILLLSIGLFLNFLCHCGSPRGESYM